MTPSSSSFRSNERSSNFSQCNTTSRKRKYDDSPDEYEEEKQLVRVVAPSRHRLPFLPRIPKNDIRRSYGIMFTNVYNSASYEVIDKFADAFMVKTCAFTMRDFRTLHCTKQLRGGAAARFWYERMFDAPDLVFRYEAEKIKVRTDGTATLSGRYQINGTRIVSTLAEQEVFLREAQCVLGAMRAQQYRLAGATQSFVDSCSSDSSIVEPTSHSGDVSTATLSTETDSCGSLVGWSGHESATANSTFSPRVFPYAGCGRINFHIDSHMRIEHIEMFVDNEVFLMQ